MSGFSARELPLALLLVILISSCGGRKVDLHIHHSAFRDLASPTDWAADCVTSSSDPCVTTNPRPLPAVVKISPDEYEPLAITVVLKKPRTGVTVNLADFNPRPASLDERITADIRVVHKRERTGRDKRYGRRETITDLLVKNPADPMQGSWSSTGEYQKPQHSDQLLFDIGEGQNGAVTLWVNLYVPPEYIAAPGNYTSTISLLDAEGKVVVTQPLLVQVLDIELQKPQLDYVMHYPLHPRTHTMSLSEFTTDLEDIAAHGMTGLELARGPGDYGGAGVQKIKDLDLIRPISVKSRFYQDLLASNTTHLYEPDYLGGALILRPEQDEPNRTTELRTYLGQVQQSELDLAGVALPREYYVPLQRKAVEKLLDTGAACNPPDESFGHCNHRNNNGDGSTCLVSAQCPGCPYQGLCEDLWRIDLLWGDPYEPPYAAFRSSRPFGVVSYNATGLVFYGPSGIKSSRCCGGRTSIDLWEYIRSGAAATSDIKKEYLYWTPWSNLPLLNRLMTGYFLHHTNMDGARIWLYQSNINRAVHGDPWDDSDVVRVDGQSYEATDSAVQGCFLDHDGDDVVDGQTEQGQNCWRMDWQVTYPAVNGPVPTLRWEAIREGVDDVRYLEELLRRIAVLPEESDRASWANRIESYLFRFRDPACFDARITDYDWGKTAVGASQTCDYWATGDVALSPPPSGLDALTPEDYQITRQEIIDAILSLPKP